MGYGDINKRIINYYEKYFIIIITNSTHLSTSLTFNVEDDRDYTKK